jgi:hypothetical protein
MYEPLFFNGVEKYRRDIQATEFLRKCEGLPIVRNLENLARKGFYACELQCKLTNDRLDHHYSNPVFTTELQWRADRYLEKSRKWLHKVLKDLPPSLDGRFGPGATFESKDWRLSHGMVAYDKLQFSPSITFGAVELEDHLVWDSCLQYSWSYAVDGRLIPRVHGDRFATAPKSAIARRPLAIQPGVNMLGQLAMGAALSQVLLRTGIDIRGDHANGRTPAQSKHRSLARLASIRNDDATIDLTNASDTVAKRLVKLQFPEEWFNVMDSLRAESTLIKGHQFLDSVPANERWVRLEKFSAMGNGYTFELETLLFCSLLHAVGCRIGIDTWVYGDDIILPRSLSRDAIAFLQYCGFTPNMRKTFTDGYFRESCGGDFLNGSDVRPYYLKEIPSAPSEWISVANGLWEVSTKWGIPALMAVRNNALDNVPSDIRRCRGPQALGDLVVHDSEEKWLTTIRSSIRYIRVWRPVTPLKELFYRRKVRDCRFGPPRPGDYRWITTRLSKRYNRGVPHTVALMGLPSDGLAARDTIAGYRFGRVAWS